MTKQKTAIINDDIINKIANRVKLAISYINPCGQISKIMVDDFDRPALRGTDTQKAIRQKLSEALTASIPKKNGGVNPTVAEWLDQITVARKKLSTPPDNILDLDWRPVVNYYDHLVSSYWTLVTPNLQHAAKPIPDNIATLTPRQPATNTSDREQLQPDATTPIPDNVVSLSLRRGITTPSDPDKTL
jgi:hypothetical protein